MYKFAEHAVAIALANQGKRDLSVGKLIKVIYFAIGAYISDKGITTKLINLYDEKFELQPYGPFHVPIYYLYCLNGRYPILNKVEIHEEYSEFDEYIVRYLDRDMLELYQISQECPTYQNNVKYLKKSIPHKDSYNSLEKDIRYKYSLRDIFSDFEYAKKENLL